MLALQSERLSRQSIGPIGVRGTSNSPVPSMGYEGPGEGSGVEKAEVVARYAFLSSERKRPMQPVGSQQTCTHPKFIP